MSRHRSLALALTLGLTAVASVAAGVTVEAQERVVTVTVAGSLQSELGCPGDWDPACPATQLTADGGGVYSATFDVPAGAFEYKVAIDGSWDENYGGGGVANGPNIAFTLVGPATLLFRYDDTTHLVSASPTDLDATVTAEDRRLSGDSLRNRLTREQFYFVMTDRFANGDPTNDLGGYAGDRLATGFDPADKGFYHGGDLAGLRSKLGYIKRLGTTAIWLTPSFANKPVQGAPGQESAGYHGYWITDFTNIDPHLGTNAELEALIDDAHAMGMKVFFDIITNHTADVIDYEEGQYTYVSKSASPYTDVNGLPFDDRDFVNSPDFPDMDTTGFPYTPVFGSPADADAKFPDWLDDPTMYHNRGDSTFAGESSEYGDFIGLDDLFTERLEVEQGMEEIYKAWIDLGIDGFRIDTAKHVNIGFWQKFSPAMLEHADQVGTDDFFMFGEVFDSNPAFQSIYSTEALLPATLDFGFQSAAVAVTNGQPTTALSTLFAGDDYYTDTDSNAYNLPTFLGNHDMGRVGAFVGGSLDKVEFANALMFTLRGQPVVYYGDEQGFIGDGGDKDARQDMFASQVASYNDDPMVAGPTGSRDRYGTGGVVFRGIAELSRLRSSHRALQDGAQIPRFASDSAGLFAVSRIDQRDQVEYLVIANNADSPRTATFATYTEHGKFRSIYGGGGKLSTGAGGQVTVTVPPLTVRVFKADHRIRRSHAAPAIALTTPAAGGLVAGRAEIRAAVPANEFTRVTFAYRPVGTDEWLPLGTDDNAPYRVFHDVAGFDDGTMLEYRAIARDNARHLKVSVTWGQVGSAPPSGGGGGPVGDVDQPDAAAIAGTLNSDMGCVTANGDPEDWAPWCDQAQLTLDTNDEIWKGTYALPAGPYAYKVALNRTWDENYGAGAVQNGANIEITAGADPVAFYYDHRTHWVTSSVETSIVVAAGSFQSEMGCAADWDAACMRSWLQDPDGDGVYTLSTTQVPAGAYEVKATVGLAWDENYGAGGEPDGPNIVFDVPEDGMVTTFAFDSVTHVLGITVSSATRPPDLSVADAFWIDDRTIAYPIDRLPAGSDPAWFRFRLHWGDLAVDATSLGGKSSALALADDPPDGYIALALDRWTARRVEQIRAAPIVAVGVYDDAQRLLDATAVAAP
jgi:glycosidase